MLPTPSRLAAWQLVALGVLSSVASAALAQSFDTDQFAPADTDLSLQMLKAAVGDWTDKSSGTISAIGAGMRIFNTGVLALAVAMFMYYAIVGTVNTAQDGRVLGQKWSTTWIPLRFVIGISLLVPTASGFSAAQYGVLYVAGLGVGGATQVANATLPYLIGASSGEAVLASPEYNENLRNGVRSIMLAEACSENLRAELAGAAGTEKPGTVQPTSPPVGMYLVTDPHVIGQAGGITGDGTFQQFVAWGSTSDAIRQNTEISRFECGVLPSQIVRVTNGKHSRPLVLRALSANGNGDVQVNSAVVDLATQPSLSLEGLVKAQVAGVAAANAAVAPVASRIGFQPYKVAPDKAPEGLDKTGASEAAIAKALDAGVAAYRAQTDTAIAAAWERATGIDLLRETIQGRGWVMLGSVFYSLGDARSKLSQASYWVPAVRQDVAKALVSDAGIRAHPIASGAVSIPSLEDGASETRAANMFTRWLATTIAGDPNNPDHALVQIKDKGDKLMAFAVSAYAAGAVTGAVTDVAKVAGGPAAKAIAGPFSSLASTLVGPVVIGLFVVGVAMSLIIPLMPFMIWCGGVMGWLIAVLEALVAAPIWMAGHLHPEGDDVTGKGIAGYLILVETIFRPVLMVFALVAAFLMVDIMLRFVGSLFFETFDLLQTDSTTGVPTMICVALLYIGLTWTLCKTSFGLIYGLPSKVWTWIGGAHASHEKAESFAGDVENVGRGAAQQVGNIGARAGSAFTAAQRQQEQQMRARMQKRRLQSDGNRGGDD